MVALQAGDLVTARGHLESALDRSGGPYGEKSELWFSISRGLAWLALEESNPHQAEGHLRLLPGYPFGIAQQSSVRANVAFALGKPDEAAAHVSAAVHHLLLDTDTDIGTLMNGAIILETCGGALVDLGYGDEARRLVSMARARIAQAGVDDPSLNHELANVEEKADQLIESGVSRTRSDPVEVWALKNLERAVGELEPYAVTVRINVTGTWADMERLVAEVDAALSRVPGLGHVDGTGSDGAVWELFLDGDDPERLWDAVNPLVAPYVTPGSEVEIRRGGTSDRRPLNPPR